MDKNERVSRVLAWPKNSNKERNPYQSLLYEGIEKNTDLKVDEFTLKSIFYAFRYDVFHLHWPDAFLASSRGINFWLKLLFINLLFIILKIFQVKIVWTVHNLDRDGQNNKKYLDKYFWPRLFKNVDGLIFMTSASKALALNRNSILREKGAAIIPHGDYCDVIDQNPKTIRRTSHIPKILFFGSITKYKNVYKLLEAFKGIPIGKAKLNISGKMSLKEPDSLFEESISTLPPSYKSFVSYRNEFLSEKDLVSEIEASDLVVFPYSDVLNSGAAIFTLSAGKPLLASDTPLFRELRENVGSDWVKLIEGDLSSKILEDALKEALDKQLAGRKPDLSYFSWSSISIKTYEFYMSLLRFE